MNKKEVLATATFLLLHTGFIFAGFSWMLSATIEPVRENQVRLEKRMDRIGTRMDRMEMRMDRIGTRMDRMEMRMEKWMDHVMSKLDQILIAQNIHHKGKIRPANKSKNPAKASPIGRNTASH